MSAPFDPSKLSFDISKKAEENIPSTEQQSKKNTVREEKKEPGVAYPDDDILGSVENNTPVSTEKEEKNSKETNTPAHTITSSQPSPSQEKEQATNGESDADSSLPQIKGVEGEEQAAIEDTTKDETQKIIDININSLDDLIILQNEKKYDYITLEPGDREVQITFRQDNIDKEIKYIKYPVYTNILFKTKQLTVLSIEDTGSPQEGKGKIKIGTSQYLLTSKTVPSSNGEKLWIKSKVDTSKKGVKQTKKTSLSTIFGFLGAVMFISLILGGMFIAFIVLNAQSVEDVQFFENLGINLNDINAFIRQIVTVIFSILLFICTAALSFALFKFLLTKKIYKRKKMLYGLLSALLFFITFGTASAWMYIHQKINELPNWQEQAYGDLKVFDNTLRVSDEFTENQALITDTTSLIGPIELSFDLNNFQTNQSRQGLNITKYIWNFGDETIETFRPEVIKNFDNSGNYEISVVAIGTDLQGQEVRQDITNMPAITLTHTIDITERIMPSGGKRVSFDANSLSNLGTIHWYLYEPTSESNTSPRYPEWTEISDGYEFIPGIQFFEEAYVGITISGAEGKSETLDKIIRIGSDGSSDISGEIVFEQSLEDERDFEFSVANATTNFANGFIERYEWTIEDKTYSVDANSFDTNTSASIEHSFSSFGEKNIRVTLTDSSGRSETLSRNITIQKRVQLRENLIIQDENINGEIDTLRYEAKTHEYFIDDLGIPTTLNFDARRVRPENIIYSLVDVQWDIDDDGNIDGTGKNFSFEIPTEGNHILAANYVFQHRRNKEDVINLKESIFIEGVKKEAILDLKMEYPNNYVPVTVRFDASSSFIKNDDVVKFVYDYGNGIIEERDAINPGHRYTEPGDYTVTLTIVGKSGKSYSTQKSLILLPQNQSVEISTSLRRAPIGQGIDFSSAGSSGQIIEYFWDFGDGNISTQANPSHNYDRAGTYSVKLRASFSNNNVIEDEVEIEIYESDE